jgi:hypothetical protein
MVGTKININIYKSRYCSADAMNFLFAICRQPSSQFCCINNPLRAFHAENSAAVFS